MTGLVRSGWMETPLGALANRGGVQRRLDAHLLAARDVGHLDDAGGRVRRVLRQEHHGTGVRDVAVGVGEGEVRRVAVALQVHVRVVHAERAVDAHDLLPRLVTRLDHRDVPREVLGAAGVVNVESSRRASS